MPTAAWMAYFGKMDMGHGLHVAIGQIVAEELDVPFKSVKVIMGDTATSVNQGGASGSTGIQDGGKQMRVAAAEARRVLVEMAAAKLDAQAANLIVVNGVVSDAFNRDKKTSYAELIGGKYFNVQLEWNKNTAIRSTRRAKPSRRIRRRIRSSADRSSARTWRPRCSRKKNFVTDVKVPGMVHGRMIRPAIAGAVPVKVDDSAIKSIPARR